MHATTQSYLLLMMEFDAASGVMFVRGKDGRLYRRRDVAALETRAMAGDASAVATLVVVDFGVGADGAELSREQADAALLANAAAWERGDYDHLVTPGELETGPRKPRPHWLGAGRARRERAAEARRNRQHNSSVRPVIGHTAATGLLAGPATITSDDLEGCA